MRLIQRPAVKEREELATPPASFNQTEEVVVDSVSEASKKENKASRVRQKGLYQKTCYIAQEETLTERSGAVLCKLRKPSDGRYGAS